MDSPADGSRNIALGFHAGSSMACGSAGKQVAKLSRHCDSQNLSNAVGWWAKTDI